MNNGFFNFPSIVNNIIDVEEFDTSGSYSIPPNAKSIIIFAVGPGSGGAGGVRLNANGCSGGTGGGCGQTVLTQIDEKSFFGISTLNIVIGAGGTGGAGSASNGATPSNGGFGGVTTVSIPGKPGNVITVGTGSIGQSGSTAFGSTSRAVSGTTAGMSLLFGASYVLPSNTAPWINAFTDSSVGFYDRGGRGSVDTAGGACIVMSPYASSGAGGGGVSFASPAGTATAGGNIKIVGSSDFTFPAALSLNNFSISVGSDYALNETIYSGGAINTATAPSNSDKIICPDCMFSCGFGGAGGGGGASTSANNGANGYRGGGGGGGGGAKNVTAGNGGNGGNGYVKIVSLG